MWSAPGVLRFQLLAQKVARMAGGKIGQFTKDGVAFCTVEVEGLKTERVEVSVRTAKAEGFRLGRMQERTSIALTAPRCIDPEQADR